MKDREQFRGTCSLLYTVAKSTAIDKINGGETQNSSVALFHFKKKKNLPLKWKPPRVREMS